MFQIWRSASTIFYRTSILRVLVNVTLFGVSMLGITTTDWLVIAGYLLIITVLGVWSARRVTSSASLFIGDRKFGK